MKNHTLTPPQISQTPIRSRCTTGTNTLSSLKLLDSNEINAAVPETKSESDACKSGTINTNFIDFPSELLRKIICECDIDTFIIINKSCRMIYSLHLMRLLIPWGIEGICTKYDSLSMNTRKRYAAFDRKRGPLYCMYDLIVQLSQIIGDVVIWDYHEVNQHDFVYLLLQQSEKPWYSIVNPIKIRERSRLYFEKIPIQYHKDIMKSLSLRALI